MLYIILLVCLCLAVALHKFKLYERIIGYERMSEEKQEESHAQSISIYLAIIFYVFALISSLMILSDLFAMQKVYDALFVLMFIMFFAVLMDAPRYIRMLKDEHEQPLKFSKRKYMKMVRYLSFFGILIVFFIYLIFR